MVVPLFFALLLATASLWMFTRNNDFPLHYHPDEPGKVAQVMHPAQIRNFNHPLLMLEAANAVRIGLRLHDERAIGIAGRWTSAALAAIAVLGFALAGYCCGGYRGLILCGGIVALCPALDVYAHFFKEDTALLSGLAVSLAGASWFVTTNRQSVQLAAAAVMGIGCAAAISGKYVGVAAVIPCLLAIFLQKRIEPRSLLWRFLAFAVPTVALVHVINFRAFQNVFQLGPAASARVIGEFFHATTGHDGLALAVPNIFSLQVSISELMPDVWLFVAISMVLLVRGRLLNRATAVGIAFLLTFAVVLSYSAFPFPRYALPITALGYFVAGQLMTCVLCGVEKPSWLNQAAFVTCLGLIIAVQGTQVWRLNKQFADDSRQRLREWVAQYLGEETTILAEDFTGLETVGDPWRYPGQGKIKAKIITIGSAADRALTIDDLKATGVDYVVVAEPEYERFFRTGIHSISYEQEEDLLRRQLFYAELFARAKLVWSSTPLPPSHAYVNPELRVYRLADSALRASRTSQESAKKHSSD